MRPTRVPLRAFPDIVLHADELAVKRHPQYAAAKAGDADAAETLVENLTNRGCLTEVSSLLQGRDVRLLPVHALESEGVNEIPAALARLLSEWLGLSITGSVVQSNTVGHTGASGFQRLANQALFAGELERGRSYLLVDDFIGQGGTFANLIGYVESAYAEMNHLSTTQLRNKAGKFVTPNMESYQAAAASADWSKVQNFAIDLNDQPGDNSWPIESATFVLLPTDPKDPSQSAAVKKFFDWGFAHGNDIAVELLYIPLPEAVQNAVRAVWQKEVPGTM